MKKWNYLVSLFLTFFSFPQFVNASLAFPPVPNKPKIILFCHFYSPSKHKTWLSFTLWTKTQQVFARQGMISLTENGIMQYPPILLWNDFFLESINMAKDHYVFVKYQTKSFFKKKAKFKTHLIAERVKNSNWGVSQYQIIQKTWIYLPHQKKWRLYQTSNPFSKRILFCQPY